MHPTLYPFALVSLLILLPVLLGCVVLSVFLSYTFLVLGSSFRRGVGAFGLLCCYLWRSIRQT